jgi:hypothetical protein
MCALCVLQVRARNLASARAFLHACSTSDVADCRILDLFSPTLAWIDDESSYQTGDPVHFRGHLLHGMREWIRRVLRPLVQDVQVNGIVAGRGMQQWSQHVLRTKRAAYSTN